MGALQSTPTSTTSDEREYEVFISFRGEDTRDNITSHLYDALCRNKIHTFVDYKVEPGEKIWPRLKKAIKESKITVVIFSEDYTSSKWCLRELAKIMKYERLKKQVVIPVFYQVDPSDVRKQSMIIENSFHVNHEKESQEELKIWREALTDASNLKGWDSSKTRPEAHLVNKIVKDIWRKLNNIPCPCDFQSLSGYEYIEKVISMLCLGRSDFRIIGILGMGGIGKTTIADAIFKLISSKFIDQFEDPYFIPNIREISNKSGDNLYGLRDKILSKILHDEKLEVCTPSFPQSIKDRLKHKKVFIVLDDVDKFRSLEFLAGGLDQIGAGSRIIVTTRNEKVLRYCGLSDHNIYRVKGFSDLEAMKFFCNIVFNQNHPTRDLEVLSSKVVNYANGNPLALKVIGSSLKGKGKQLWNSALDRSQRILDSEILDVLKISYDGLNDEEKCVFLDIACFFKEKNKDYVAKILGDPDRYFSMDILVDKSLITLSEFNKIQMHCLIEEMGKEIVRKESLNDPGKRSRLWKEEDVLRTLENNIGTDAVQGIILEMSSLKDIYLSPQAFEKMRNIRFLRFYYWTYGRFSYKFFDNTYISKVHLLNGLNYLPAELRSLVWHGYPLKVLPSTFSPENLVELDLSNSNIEQLWEGTKHAPKLKRLMLSHCQHLTKISDLLDFPSIEVLDVENCSVLLDIHSSVGHLKYLHELNLWHCQNLKSFPSKIHYESLVTLDFHGTRLTELPEIFGTIERLNLSGTDIDEVPSSIQSLTKLRWLDLSKCIRLKHISTSICSLKSLEDINLQGCDLNEIPEDIGCMSSLKILNLSGNGFESLPKSIKQLSNLECLYIDNCSMLQSLTGLPPGLTKLRAIDCKQLRSIPDASEFAELLITQYNHGDSVCQNFIFTNCLNLDETAFSNIFQLLINQHIATGVNKEYKSKPVHVGFCYPGSEVPRWFSNHTQGSSINIQLLRHDCFNGPLMGFAVYAVIAFELYYHRYSFELDLCYRFKYSDEYENPPKVIPVSSTVGTLVDSDHVALGYCEASVPEFTNCSFVFWLSWERPDCRVKYCGVCPIYGNANTNQAIFKERSCTEHPIYAEPIKSSGVTIQCIGETIGKRSARSDDHKEEAEPHCKSICTEANRCSQSAIKIPDLDL